MTTELEGETGPVQDGLTSDDKTWGMLSHISGLSMLVIPFGQIIGPLVVYLSKKESAYVQGHAKEALNFGISATIYLIASGILLLAIIGIVLLPIVYIGSLVLFVIAGIKANDGHSYKYPLTIRFIK